MRLTKEERLEKKRMITHEAGHLLFTLKYIYLQILKRLRVFIYVEIMEYFNMVILSCLIISMYVEC